MSDTCCHPPAPAADLSDAVTVFVTTVGAPTFGACMDHLRAQDCRFTLRLVEHVAPMHAAFQRMLDECRTPYYVQVDEDMLLDPHAVRTLHAHLAGAGPGVAMVVGALFDVHLQRCITGIKIFRHAIVRHYPFNGTDCFENDQVDALRADGYALRRVGPDEAAGRGDALGLHGTRWTAASIYERYATLERRRRTAPPSVAWFASCAEEFLARFQDDPSEENFFALMGVLAGVLASRNGPAPAKDFRTYAALPGFAALREFLAAVDGIGAAPPPAMADRAAAAPPRPPSAARL